MSQQKGTSLILTIFLLSTLLIVSTVVAGIVFRVGTFPRSIGASEIAFLAAEASIEAALYKIERGDITIGSVSGSGSLVDITDASYSVIAFADSVPPSDNTKFQATTPGDPITSTNPLVATLDNGEFVQLDFIIRGVVYPETVQITSTGGSVTISHYNETDGQVNGATTPLTIGTVGSNPIDPSNSFHVKVENNSGSQAVVTFTPAANAPLPLQMVISSTGIYRGQERNLQVERPMWIFAQ